MSGVDDPVGPAPEVYSVRFVWLLAGASIPPVFWLGQMMLAYGVTAYVCYPGDHPIHPGTGPLTAALILFDLVALAACVAGGFVSLRIWRRGAKARNRFLALWGMLSSLCFFCAILFNVIASLAVPLCGV